MHLCYNNICMFVIIISEFNLKFIYIKLIGKDGYVDGQVNCKRRQTS